VKDYVTYLEFFKNYSSKWDYLESYCIRDVEIAIKPINNMIKMFEELGMDMFSSISLSSNANAIKHKMMYDDLDVNTNYADNNNNEPDFEYNFQWSEMKAFQ
jgi:hypothetical protein